MGLDNRFNVLAGRACELETWGLQKYFRPCPLVLCGLQFTGLTSASCLVIFLGTLSLVVCGCWEFSVRSVPGSPNPLSLAYDSFSSLWSPVQAPSSLRVSLLTDSLPGTGVSTWISPQCPSPSISGRDLTLNGSLVCRALHDFFGTRKVTLGL